MRLSRPVSLSVAPSSPAPSTALPLLSLTTVALALYVLSLLLLPPGGGPGTAGPDTPGATDRDSVSTSLERLSTVPRRTHVLGYSRDHFGGWADQWWAEGTGTVSTESGSGPAGTRCSTRHIVMLQTFGSRSPGDDGSCPSPRGRITDVYTGDMIAPSDVEIDHVVPLSAAWDHGAWDWPRELRVRFANDDELNLLAVAGTVNRDKSDGSLGEWLPPTAKAGSLSEAGCAYAARYLAVCLRYGLSVSDADATTARQVCGL